MYSLDFITFYVIYRDAIIELHSHSEEDIDWLNDCHRLTETEMDIEGVRKLVGKEDEE